ncbi:MAG: bifunctional hydroxymethylpyrimidine kinase/phosphomethylpyrimidine kinase [Verrucomicrobiae bacterium]|nr:bifunctional hydroxymethylpyrimidine kinase/phosphomethylpyrimidine kinase [Verrucomicrobiae bacterium]
MNRRVVVPVALTVAGSDSGGGAGVQADLKTFAALGVHGASVITCVTAQNPREVIGIHAVPAQIVKLQLEAVFDELPPAAAKTGMLYSAEIIRVVARFFQGMRRRTPLVVDPVMVATSGAALAQRAAVRALKELLLPIATVVTPNLHEAEVLSGKSIRTAHEMCAVARELQAEFGCAVVVKGGHLEHPRYVLNCLADGRGCKMFRAARVTGVSTHGTGCMFSAAVAARLARGDALDSAVREATRFVSRAIAESRFFGRAGKHSVLNAFWARPSW